MNNPATQQIQVLKTVAEWADQFTCIRKIHVFGSFARGEEFSDMISPLITSTMCAS